ncbi:MAG: response regulator, partial [bacterium]|nr:response regulator [bacterium]
MKILLFDDDNDFAAALQESLSDHHKIVSTGNYYQAKEYLIKDNFDLIVSEIKDSDDNNIGINFLKIIKASGIEPPIIMLASKSDISLAVESVKLGASDFIEKSADYETTIINIENAIEKLVEAGPKNRKKDQGIKTDCKFLFVDDNQEFTKSIKFYCGKKYYIETINDFLGARGVIDENKYDCIFLDINDEVNNDDKAGVKLLKDIIAKDPDIPVIMLSGWTNAALAVECLKLGAYDFLEKSLKIYETIEKVEGILKKITKGKERDNKDLEETFAGPSYRVIDIIGECEKVRKIKQEIIDVADHHDVPVLIYGETGTGKEMVASAIHIASSRRDHSFVELDCSAIPDSIFESELFGYTKGAFTGAVGSRKGKMEQAHNGTLFLDEIENLSLDQQSKLLKVL